MRTFTLCCALVIAALGVVACGGASNGLTAPAVATPTPPAATPTPMAPGATPTPMAPAGATTLATASLLGSPGFTAPTSGHTVYMLSGDTPTSLECTVASGCTGVWPPIAPPAGVALSTGFTVFARPDNGAMQLAYLGHPLYTFAGDTAAGQTNGNGLVSFGGTWSISRP
jgi:predicted lipoprotein with Yx(FWY)xxD motif